MAVVLAATPSHSLALSFVISTVNFPLRQQLKRRENRASESWRACQPWELKRFHTSLTGTRRASDWLMC